MSGIHNVYSPFLLGPRATLGVGDNDVECNGVCQCGVSGLHLIYHADIEHQDSQYWRQTGEWKLLTLANGDEVEAREYVCVEDEPKFFYTVPKYIGKSPWRRKAGTRVWLPTTFIVGSSCVIIAELINAEYTELAAVHHLSMPMYLERARASYGTFAQRFAGKWGRFTQASIQDLYTRAAKAGRRASLYTYLDAPWHAGAGLFWAELGASPVRKSGA